LWVAIRSALLPSRHPGRKGEIVTTLIDKFRYPRLGPGQMWEKAAAVLADANQPVLMGRTLLGIEHSGGRVRSVITRDEAGKVEEHEGAHFISSIPVRELVGLLDPAAPDDVRKAAAALSYRDFITVAVMIDRPDVFPDNWIYIHDPSVKVGRIQNFKNWSPDMVPDQAKTCLGLEYFCFEGDGLWTMADADLVELAAGELAQLGITTRDQVAAAVCVGQQKAYPVYADVYQERVAVIREYLAA